MRTAALAILLGVAVSTAAPGQGLPFAPGERLTYQARAAKLGNIGTAVMAVEGPVDVRGQSVYHLRFQIDTKVGFIRVLNRSESCLDAAHMTSLRFEKHERHPLAKHEERVDIYPEDQRWEAADGTTGRTMSDQPLDELSFIYFLRTVHLEPAGALRFDRHFEMERNPTLVRTLGRETIQTPAGTFQTLVVEMEVRDARYKGGGAIKVYLTDDARRLPVRMESSVPLAGKVVLSLESYQAGAAGVVAKR